MFIKKVRTCQRVWFFQTQEERVMKIIQLFLPKYALFHPSGSTSCVAGMRKDLPFINLVFDRTVAQEFFGRLLLKFKDGGISIQPGGIRMNVNINNEDARGLIQIIIIGR